MQTLGHSYTSDQKVLIFLSFSKSFSAHPLLQECFPYVADEAGRRGPVGDHMLGHC